MTDQIDNLNAGTEANVAAPKTDQQIDTELRARLKSHYSDDDHSGDPESGEGGDQPKAGDDVKSHAKRAREKLDQRKLERDNVRLKKMIDAAANDPNEALALSKLSARDIITQIKDRSLRVDTATGKFVKADKDAPLLDAKEAKLQELEDRLASYEKERKDQSDRAHYDREIQHADAIIEKYADEFPLFAGVDRNWAKGRLVDIANKPNFDPRDIDVAEILAELEEELRETFKPVVSSKRSIGALLKDPATRALIIEELGLSDADAGQREVLSFAGKKKSNGASALSRSVVSARKASEDNVKSTRQRVEDENDDIDTITAKLRSRIAGRAG